MSGLASTSYRAPWSRLLHFVSWISTAVLVGLAIFCWFEGKHLHGSLAEEEVAPTRAPESGKVLSVSGLVLIGTSALPIFMALSAAPFVIRGYRLEGAALHIQRLFWTTSIPLRGLQSAEVLPKAMRGSIRVCGNGGLYSFTGWWWSPALKSYQPYVNDLDRTVVLRFAARTVVISPDEPAAFVRDLRERAAASP